MKSKRLFAVSALMAAMVAPVMADDQIYLTPSAGFQLFDDKKDLSEAAVYEFKLGYRFLPNWAVEAVYGKGKIDRKYVAGDDDYRDYRIDGFYYFNDNPGVQPYIATGAGQNKLDDNKSTRMNLGGGLRYVMTENVHLNADVRQFFGFDQDTWDTMVSTGITLAFTRPAAAKPAPAPAPAPAPTPAPAPAPAPVDGDADNDGVPDSRDKCPNTKAGAKVDENGCEGKKATLETIRLNVQFPTNSDRIDPSYDTEIRKVADFLKRFPDSTVEIEGHTDSTGGRALNMDLSQRRANSVMNRLVQVHGVNPNRVTAVGYGPDRPVASNDTPAGRQQNRRVDARMEQIVE